MLHYYGVVTLHAMAFLKLLPYNYIISSYTTYTMCKTVVLTVVDDTVLYNLSKVILFVNFLKLLSYLVISLFLLTGQFSDHNTAAINLSL
jgi:hypothetical protein